jgi:chromosome segregation ATPase
MRQVQLQEDNDRLKAQMKQLQDQMDALKQRQKLDAQRLRALQMELRRMVGSMKAAQRARTGATKVAVGVDDDMSERMSRQHVHGVVQKINQEVRSAGDTNVVVEVVFVLNF